MGVLELTALPSIGAERWVPWVRETDVLLVNGGDALFPHLDNPLCPENDMAGAEKWAAEIAGPAYAIDDETAIRVTDGAVHVVSEGHWKLFPS